MREMACVLARTRSQRVIWGTNWPHPAYTGDPPNDGALLDLVAEWFPDARMQRQILVDNPQALFGFPPQASTVRGSLGNVK
jgi:predicted TIM-barrel fold metal-dependent hydrolase